MKASRELALLVVFASNECEARPKVLAHPGLVACGVVNFVKKPGGTSVAFFLTLFKRGGRGSSPCSKDNMAFKTTHNKDESLPQFMKSPQLIFSHN